MNYPSQVQKRLKEFQSSPFLSMKDRIMLLSIQIMVRSKMILDYVNHHLGYQKLELHNLVHNAFHKLNMLIDLYPHQFYICNFRLIKLMIHHLYVKMSMLHNIQEYHDLKSQSKKEIFRHCIFNQLGKDKSYYLVIYLVQCSKFNQIVYSYNLYS